jgi:TrmH family RNA methyltransferase
VPVTNQELKDTRSLLTKKGRREKKQFVAEGVRLLEEAVRFRFWPTRVYYSNSLLSDRGRALLAQFGKRRVPTEQVPASRFAGLCDTKTPQGLLAVFDIPETRRGQPLGPPARTILVCDGVGDPGNLGTLMRSALAFGFREFRLFGNAAEPWAPRVVRASAGALFGLRIAPITEPVLRRMCEHDGYALLVADVNGRPSTKVLGRNWKDRKIVLAVGSEAQGVSSGLLAAASARVWLEHDTAVESLNAAVAASILMKNIYDLKAR